MLFTFFFFTVLKLNEFSIIKQRKHEKKSRKHVNIHLTTKLGLWVSRKKIFPIGHTTPKAGPD